MNEVGEEEDIVLAMKVSFLCIIDRFVGSPSNRVSSFLYTIPVFVLGAVLCAAIAVVLWGADRGLAFDDEGNYLLGARYPSEIQQNVSAIYTFTGHIFRLTSYNPVSFRMLGVAAVILSALIFWMGFYKLVIKLLPDAAHVRFLKHYSLLFIMIGAGLHYQWSYLTPSYYTLTAVVVNIFSGCVFLGLVRLEAKDFLQAYMAFFVVGIIFGLTLFLKFPTAIPLLFASIALILLWGGAGFSMRIRLLAVVLFGFLAWLAIYFSFEQTPWRTLELFQEGWRLYQTLGYHKPTQKLLDYPKDFFVLVYTVIFEYWLCYVLIVFGVLIKYSAPNFSPDKFRIFFQLLTWAVVALALLVSLKDGVFVDVPERLVTAPVEGRTRPYLSFQLGWILLLSAVLLFYSLRGGIKRWGSGKLHWMFLFLLLLPIAGSLGTSNPIYNVIQFYVAPWFGAILFLLIMLIIRYKIGSALLVFVVLSISAFASSHIIQGSVFQPAQIRPRNLLDQSIPTAVGHPPYYLNLDLETHNIVEQLSIAAKSNGFLPGDDIIGFDNIAGLVFALGGRSPGHPVFPCCYSKSMNEYSKMALQLADKTRLKKSFILLGINSQSDISSILDSVGIRFPDDYQLVGKVSGLKREFTLYRPTQR